MGKKKRAAKKTTTKATAKKKAATKKKSTTPRSFNGVIRGRTPEVRRIANALRDLVYEEMPAAEESYFASINPMAMYRTSADVCWIQPLKSRCNVYFLRGVELTDEEGILEGTSDSFRHAKVETLEAVEELPIRDWIRESLALNEASQQAGSSFQEVLERVRGICLALPDTKETRTWGRPHFRVGEKIFAGCGEHRGSAVVGLKMERDHSERMMQLPGIVKAPYSREGDGWVSIDPAVFDDWEEIETSLVDSFKLIAPKRTVALLDGGEASAPKKKRKTTKKKPATTKRAKKSS